MRIANLIAGTCIFVGLTCTACAGRNADSANPTATHTEEADAIPARSGKPVIQAASAADKIDSAVVLAVQQVQSGASSGTLANGARVDSTGRVLVYVRCAREDPARVRSGLSSAGMAIDVDVQVDDDLLYQGWVPADQMEMVASLPFVRRITLPRYGTIR